MKMTEGRAMCAVCESADTPAGKEMCVNISGKHFHVLVCIECHLREIGMTCAGMGILLSQQQKEINKLVKKPKLGVVQ